MSTLSRFIDRHGLNNGRMAATLGGITLAAMMSTIIATPAKAEMASLELTVQNVEIIQQSSERITDRMKDVAKVKATIEEISKRMTATKAQKFKLSNEADRVAFEETPNPAISEYDAYLLKIPASIPEDSQLAEFVTHLNWQKAQLQQATNYLDAMKLSFTDGNKQMREQAANMLSDLLENYNAQSPEVVFDNAAPGNEDIYNVDTSVIRQELAMALK
jgi:cell division protein FtsB